jgi:hypothetical protein
MMAEVSDYVLRRVFVFLVSASVASYAAAGTEYHVSVDGDDGNSGSVEQPFRTIQRAADLMGPGDVCRVRAGTYRESVRVKRGGRAGSPVRFVAEGGGLVVLDGTDVLTGNWSVHEGSIYKIRSRRRVTQLFLDGEMMVEYYLIGNLEALDVPGEWFYDETTKGRFVRVYTETTTSCAGRVLRTERSRVSPCRAGRILSRTVSSMISVGTCRCSISG